MKYISTIDMYEQVINCEEIDELKEFLNKYSPYYSRWRDYVNDILLNNSLSYEKLGKICGFSKNTIKSWVKNNKLPKSRDVFIKFGLGLRCTLHEMNYILQRYGRYPKLYSKSLEDAICIYVISHYPEDESINAYQEYKKLKEKYLSMIQIKNKRQFLIDSKDETLQMEENIIQAENEKDFMQFVKEHHVEYMNSYYKLLDYIISFVKAENMESSYHSLVVGKNMDKGYEKMISNLRNWGEVPNRKRLIALGINLNMSLGEINTMLSYANMERLCPKDKIECIILFVLANIDVSNPYYEINHAVLVSSYTENPTIKEQCSQLLNELIGLKNSEEIKEDVEYYVKDVLNSLEMNDDEDFIRMFQG